MEEEQAGAGAPAPRELTDEEKKKYMVGQCNYLLLMTLSLTALILGQNSIWTCNYASRTLTYKAGFDVDSTCREFTGNDAFYEEICKTFLSDHGIGFYHWMATIPVNQLICMTYTLPIDGVGYVSPQWDAAFNAGEVFGVMAIVFGSFGWFTTIIATCCPVSQERIVGLSCYFTFACICQCFTFLMYASNACEVEFYQPYFPNSDVTNSIESVTCGLADGAKMSITAAVLYAVCSSLAPFCTAPKPVRFGGYGRAPTSEPAPAAAAPAPPPSAEGA